MKLGIGVAVCIGLLVGGAQADKKKKGSKEKKSKYSKRIELKVYPTPKDFGLNSHVPPEFLAFFISRLVTGGPIDSGKEHDRQDLKKLVKKFLENGKKADYGTHNVVDGASRHSLNTLFRGESESMPTERLNKKQIKKVVEALSRFEKKSESGKNE